jgi:hypothetical protein
MNQPEVEVILSADDEGRPLVRVGTARAGTLPALVGAAPELARPENLAAYCAAVNHLTYGSQYRLIRDPDAYRAKYQRRLHYEDPRQPWQEGVVRVCDFGVADTSQIQAPRLEGASVVFYVEDDYLGIPYCVTGPAPDHPDGEVVYDPLPMSPAG